MSKPFNPVIPDYTSKDARKKAEEEKYKILLSHCLICHKQVEGGYYGVWSNGGTCSRKCEQAQELVPKDYPRTPS